MTLPQWTPGPGYTALSLKVIQDEFGCTIFAPPPAPTIYPTITSLTPSSTIIIDESSYRYINYTVNFVNRNQRRVYWSAYYGAATQADFEALPAGEIDLDTATFTVIIATDAIVEGNETYAIQFKLDPTGPAFYTSSPYTIIDSIPATPTPSPGSTPTPIPSPSPAPLIPTTYVLTLSGPLTVDFGKSANISLSGAPNDTIVFKYVKPNIDNLYFDYNPDVAQAYAMDNQGLTKEQYAQKHYESYGRSQLRTSPTDLQIISEPLNGATSLSSTGNKTFDLFSNKKILGRTTPYTFQFYGSKTGNVINYSIKVKVFYRLGVYGTTQIQSGERSYLQVFGYPSDSITYLGSTNGTFFLDSVGLGNFDITGGSTLTNGNYNWSFSGNNTPNTEYYSLKVNSYTLSVTGSSLLIVGDNDTTAIIVTITGAPNETINYTGFISGSVILDTNGRLTGDINQDDTVVPGNYTITFSGSRSNNTSVYKFEIRKYSEAILPGPSPYRHRIGNPITISLTGGVSNSGVTVSFTGPNGSSGVNRYQLNENGVLSIDNQQFVNAGVYTYIADFSGTGNRRTHLIEVVVSNLRVVQSNYTIANSNAYDSTQPIVVEVQGAPNEIVAISQPSWPSLVPVYGETQTFRNFLRSNGYLRGYVETQYIEGTEVSTWTNYPIKNGFPARYLFLDASGKSKINLNGDEAINITAQASDFSWSREQQSTFVSILGQKINTEYSRGHTLFVLSNVDLSVESISNYDTYDGGTIIGGVPIEFTGIENALNNVANQKIIVLTSFESIRISDNMRTILNTSYGGTLTDKWTSTRLSLAMAGHVFIGIKNGGVPAVEKITRGGASQVSYFVPGINTSQNGLPHLMKYNYDSYQANGTTFYYDTENDRWDLTTIDPTNPRLLKLAAQRQMYEQVPYSFSVIGNKSLIPIDFTINIQKPNYVKNNILTSTDSSSKDDNLEDIVLVTTFNNYIFDKKSYIVFEGNKLDISFYTKNVIDNSVFWYRLEGIDMTLDTGFNTSGTFVVNKNIGTFSITYGTKTGGNGNKQARLIVSVNKDGPEVVEGPIINIFDPAGPNPIGI